MSSTKGSKVIEDVEARYLGKTKKSGKLHEKALEHMPGGETRESISYKPYTSYMDRGEGCRLWDVDGNEYTDFVGNYTSLVHGHCDPDIMAAVRAQVEKGCALSSTSHLQIEHARILCSRTPSVDMVRYANSGTEATTWAIRAARAVTGKDMVLKFEGCYHGTQDTAKVSVVPDLAPDGLPEAHVEGLGIPKSVLQDVIVAPFNDLDAAEAQLKNHGDKLACIITEPFLASLGVITPKPGYLQGLRDLADKYGVLLVFDEVQSFRQSTGGYQQYEGVYPDITALGKFIGGGYPVGAFGASREIMDRFDYDPSNPDAINHSGTFNGNEITMAAGIASMKKYDQAAVDHISALGDRLREGGNDIFRELGIKCQLNGIGSLTNIIYTDQEISNAFDFAMTYIGCMELQKWVHLELINRGIYTAKRGEFIISTPMSEKEVDKGLHGLKETFEFLKPYIEESAPHLL
jgi:glutamate-1-semialdehyde 2,1-aminomutase